MRKRIISALITIVLILGMSRLGYAGGPFDPPGRPTIPPTGITSTCITISDETPFDEPTKPGFE